jgi:hypothetical protein
MFFLGASVNIHIFYKIEKNADFLKIKIRSKVFGVASNVCNFIQEVCDLVARWMQTILRPFLLVAVYRRKFLVVFRLAYDEFLPYSYCFVITLLFASI